MLEKRAIGCLELFERTRSAVATSSDPNLSLLYFKACLLPQQNTEIDLENEIPNDEDDAADRTCEGIYVLVQIKNGLQRAAMGLGL